jgi:flagellar M-ring protein FliF
LGNFELGGRVNGFGEFLARLGIARVAAMAVSAVLMIGFFAFLIFRVSTPQMAPVYTGLDFEDSAAIVSELRTMGVPFEIRGDGESILVARDQITTIRMALAESGLPTRGQVGYEIFDKQNTLGATSFVQNLNHLRALEGELARTISSLARVKSARVHLVLPERELFRREAKQPSASIVLDVRGALSTGEIRSIQHLVASAVDSLTPNMVSIVDNTGNLLAAGANGEDSILSTAGEERTAAIENKMRSRLEDMLSNVLGGGRVRVQVSAELDMNRLTRTSESFDPDGQVVRSTQTRELTNQAKGGDGGQVSVANELPGATENNGEGGTSEQSATTEETTNFEISRTTQTEVVEAGAIKRLSVAVVVDGVYTTAADGTVTYEARSDAELEQIRALVNTAVGYDQTRGDQVEVINMQFAERPDLNFEPSEAGLFDFTRDDMFAAAEMAVTLLIALALVFFVMRPLIKRVLEPEEQPMLVTAQEAVDAEGNPVDGGELKSPEEEARDQWLEEARSLGAAQIEAIERVGTLVQENPKQASMIIRNWLLEAA